MIHVNICPMARTRIIFKGKVQGVFFRVNCQKQAIKLGLSGWVQNRDNGDVESLVQGDRETIDEFIEWNRISQPHANVTNVKIFEEKDNSLPKGFRIRS